MPPEHNDPHGAADQLFAQLNGELGISKEILDFAMPAFREHAKTIGFLISEGYEPSELFFRDYLSGDKSEIRGDDLAEFRKALSHPRYDLVPCIIFRSPKRFTTGNVAKTSALWIEFHKNGNAF